MAGPAAKEKMPTWAIGNKRARQAAGLTLLELMVVMAIIGMASAAATLAWRDPSEADVAQDAQRLAALLETARANSRSSGLPVRWQVAEPGFRFDGLQGAALAQTWQHEGITAQVQGRTDLLLGPEPVIAPQSVQLWSRNNAALRWQVSTDGVRPFSAQVASGAGP